MFHIAYTLIPIRTTTINRNTILTDYQIKHNAESYSIFKTQSATVDIPLFEKA